MFLIKGTIFFLLTFSILRSFLIPLPFISTGNVSTVAGGLNVLLAALFLIFMKDNLQLIFLKIYSLIMLIPTLLFNFSLIDTSLGFLETITPIIIFSALSSQSLIDRLNLNLRFVRRTIFFILFFLLLGHILTFAGFNLPTIRQVPISVWGTGIYDINQVTFLRNRVSSFVGTAGPYSMSLAYIVIAFSIVRPKYKNIILIIGIFFETLSFSRSGLAILLVYSILSNLKNIILFISLKFSKLPKKVFLAYLILFGLIFALLLNYQEVLLAQINRFKIVLSLYGDVANQDRLLRMEDSKKIIFDSFYNFFVGTGTGMTARINDSYQYESQFVKIFIEWGLIGFLLFANWLHRVIQQTGKSGLSFINLSYLPLLITILLNLSFIQALTSSPIVSSMAISILANKIMNRKLLV